jgi:hypothetical protein
MISALLKEFVCIVIVVVLLLVADLVSLTIAMVVVGTEASPELLQLKQVSVLIWGMLAILISLGLERVRRKLGGK